jgi:hypothetical protein
MCWDRQLGFSRRAIDLLDYFSRKSTVHAPVYNRQNPKLQCQEN